MKSLLKADVRKEGHALLSQIASEATALTAGSRELFEILPQASLPSLRTLLSSLIESNANLHRTANQSLGQRAHDFIKRFEYCYEEGVGVHWTLPKGSCLRDILSEGCLIYRLQHKQLREIAAKIMGRGEKQVFTETDRDILRADICSILVQPLQTSVDHISRLPVGKSLNRMQKARLVTFVTSLVPLTSEAIEAATWSVFLKKVDLASRMKSTAHFITNGIVPKSNSWSRAEAIKKIPSKNQDLELSRMLPLACATILRLIASGENLLRSPGTHNLEHIRVYEGELVFREDSGGVIFSPAKNDKAFPNVWCSSSKRVFVMENRLVLAPTTEV